MEEEEHVAEEEEGVIPADDEALPAYEEEELYGKEEESEGEDYTPLGSSSDDPEKQRNYKEYKRLVKEINCQNEVIERIKSQIQEINCKPCLTTCEEMDLKTLDGCLQQELDKLRCLINKAMHLQNFGSKRRYKEINLVTTFDEEQMAPIMHTCETLQVQTAKGQPERHQPSTCWKSAAGGDSTDNEKSCHDQDSLESSGVCETEEQKLMREIMNALKVCKKKKASQKQRPCAKRQKKQKPCSDPSSDDMCIQKLKDKIRCMQSEVSMLKNELCRRDLESKLKKPCPQHNIEKPRQKSPSPLPSSPCRSQQKTFGDQPPVDLSILCKSGSTPRAEQFQKLKDNYLYLLTEFSKKDEQLKELTKKLKGTCGVSGNIPDLNNFNGSSGGDAKESELQLLRNRVSELTEEQVEFKCLMKEQSSQLDDYRQKYINAQQKVEEYCATIEKLNMNNKRIEKQINLEIKEIRAKFQEKLNELLQFPKLLENEQLKLAQICKEKEELENKLMIVCKELRSLKQKQTTGETTDDCRPQLQKCQQQLSKVEKNLEEVQRQRDMFCQQMKATQEDLDALRSESAKIIARTKERAELIKQQLQEQIDRLEKELAQCRATACLSVNDRELVIREMQGQLNTLSYSFDAAQKQIKTLRNHIAYMSNENCFPIKC